MFIYVHLYVCVYCILNKVNEYYKIKCMSCFIEFVYFLTVSTNSHHEVQLI